MRQTIQLHLQAAGDLCRHYSSVIGQVWAIRHQLDAKPRQAHEAEFLPAALSLQETPPSPAPRVAMWLIMGFLLLALVWSIFGRIDITATAQGKIVSSGRTKVIQPAETAVVRAIHVTDGQEVKAGDVLIELDATVTQADADKTQDELVSAQMQSARAQALMAAVEARRAPVPAWPSNAPGARVAQEQRVLMGAFADFQAKQARIGADTARREAELLTTRELVAKLEKTVPIAQRRADDYNKLAAKGFVAQHGFQDKEQARIDQEGDLAVQRGRLRELSASIAQGRADATALVAETRRGALEAYAEAEQRMAGLTQEHAKAQSRNQLMRLTAPVDGTVQQLVVHTVGGVVTPAQALMAVVPKDAVLEIEAFVENKDIGFVFDGQAAQVKLETFLFTKYGTIQAKVVHVSNDAIVDEKRGLIYAARVRLSRSTLYVDGKQVNLSPGMAATVEIKTGQRRVIEFLLSPLAQHVSEAGRER